MTSRTANCPSCGAQVEFKAGSSIVTVCPYCSTAVGRVGGDIGELETSLNAVSGVIDHGLFTSEADEVIIETASGLERMKRGE